MKWHPIKSILAIGWETGDIQIWNDTEKHLYEPQTNHCMEIKSLDWTSSGSRLLSCDYVRLFKTTYWLTHWLFQFNFSLSQSHILCGLSLHLNHLITLRVAISHRPFRTLLFGIFRHIDILRPILVIFTTHQQSCKKVKFQSRLSVCSGGGPCTGPNRSVQGSGPGPLDMFKHVQLRTSTSTGTWRSSNFRHWMGGG